MIGAVAIVGEGVVGTSAALAIRRAFPQCKVTLFSDRPFADSTSFGPAGIFRLDSDSPQQRKWATETFVLWTDLERKYHPTETGVHLVSGHMQTNDRSRLEKQERAMGDIVYNFRWLDSRELDAVFSNPAKFGVHFTAYAAEGRRYVPWLRAQLEQLGGVEFRQERVDSIQQIVDGGQFPVVVNCAGLAAGKLAADGDDQNVYPNRGVAIEVEAPGFSHFYYQDIETFCIPLVGDRLILGTLRQDNCWDKEISEQDRADIWARILELKPTLKGAKTLNEWCGLRPVRKGGVRLEHKLVNRSNGGSGAVHVIHNYGHAGNGFVLSWGCAQEVVRLMNAKMEDM